MFDLLCVTNRHLCRENFLLHMERLAAARPAGIILREKDLSERAYHRLAEQILPICSAQGVPCILHTFTEVALQLAAERIHLPLPVLRTLPVAERRRFSVLGASCHSVEEAREAETLGCTYITAGHVFDTNCKKGLPGRGLIFLRTVCDSVSLPVYAIGGITPERYPKVLQAGAAGGCLMSGAMTCTDPTTYLHEFRKERERHGN